MAICEITVEEERPYSGTAVWEYRRSRLAEAGITLEDLTHNKYTRESVLGDDGKIKLRVWRTGKDMEEHNEFLSKNIRVKLRVQESGKEF